MLKVINPLSIIGNRNVKVHNLNDEENPQMAWMYRSGKDAFEVCLNIPSLKIKYEKSWVSKSIDYETYERGVLYHELSHVLYDIGDYRENENELQKTLFNILDDTRIEHHLCYNFPLASRDLRWCLSSLKPTLNVDDLKAKRVDSKDKLKKMLDTFWKVSRFGIYDQQDDQDFLDFLLPVCLSNTTGNLLNCYKARDLIYYYIINKINDKKLTNEMSKAKEEETPISEEEIEGYSAGSILSDSGIRDFIKEVKESEKQPSYGIEAYEGESTFEITDDTKFVLQTIKEKIEEIDAISVAIRLLRQKWTSSKNFEGEYSFPDQELAYLDSFTGEENKTFLYEEKIIPSMDFTVIRDISISTGRFRHEYAQACIVLHAAMSDFTDVRTVQIDFSDDARIVKYPKQQIWDTGILPTTINGTNFKSAMDVMNTQVNMQADRKVLCILTDGAFDNKNLCQKLLNEYYESGKADFIFFIYIGEESTESTLYGFPVFYCKQIESLIHVMYEVVRNCL